MSSEAASILQLSPRGQVTLPSEVRRTLGLKPGDPLLVSVHEGKVVLQPAVVMAVELYSDARIDEFEQAASMTPAEIKKARKKWGL